MKIIVWNAFCLEKIVCKPPKSPPSLPPPPIKNNGPSLIIWAGALKSSVLIIKFWSSSRRNPSNQTGVWFKVIFRSCYLVRMEMHSGALDLIEVVKMLMNILVQILPYFLFSGKTSLWHVNQNRPEATQRDWTVLFIRDDEKLTAIAQNWTSWLSCLWD